MISRNRVTLKLVVTPHLSYTSKKYQDLAGSKAAQQSPEGWVPGASHPLQQWHPGLLRFSISLSPDTSILTVKISEEALSIL